MKKREKLSVGVWAGVVLAALPAGTTQAQVGENESPNVIYVFADQLRKSAMGFWGEPGFRETVRFVPDPVQTPNLNRFARESVVLTSAVSNFPVSSPHRGMLLTGMFPEGSGVSLNCHSLRPTSSLREDVSCISDVFCRAGYDCAYIGKWHVDHPTPNDPQRPGHYVQDGSPVWDAYTPSGRRHGFGYWYSYGTFDVHKHPHYWDNDGVRHDIDEWSPAHETGKAIAWLRNEGAVRDERKPFFLMLSFNPPHSPYRSTEDCMEEDYDLYKDLPMERLLVRPNADTTMAKAESARYYFASVTGVDRAFGRILSELRRSGLDRNTIVVFTSDHGETMCSHSLEDPKNSPYAESMDVPFLIRFPDGLEPRVDGELILSTPDIMPTLLGLCGLEKDIPASVEGRNYAGHLTGRGDSAPLREGALYLCNVDGEKDADGKVVSYFPVARGIKTHRHTMAITIDRKGREVKDILLFDDLDDPYQMHALSWKEHRETVDMLCRMMAPLLKEANDPWYRERILSDMIPY